MGHGPRLNGDRAADLLKGGFDVLSSNDNEFQEYTIAPSAVESWSIYRPEMVKEMKAELTFYNQQGPQEDDVYHAFVNYNSSWINDTLKPVIEEHEKNLIQKVKSLGAQG